MITHEYFHILQRQLSDGRANAWLTLANAWLTEGTASWVDDEHKVFGGEQMRRNLRGGQLSAITNDTPTLRSTESDNGGLEYRLGWLATDHLTANIDPEFPIEFWRQLPSTEIGPHRRWTSTLDWRTVFHRVSGQPVSEFYAEFDARQREQAVANAAGPRAYEYDGGLIPPGSYTDDDGNLVIGSYEYGGAWIRGRVTGADGAPVTGVFVNAVRVEGEVGVSLNQRAETDADGSFAVRAPEAGDYILSVDIDDDCTRYYSDDRLIDNEKQGDAWQQARPISVGQSDVSDIDIQVPPGVCGWQIRGRVVGPVGEPLAGVTVMACPVGSGTCTSVDATTYDGSFAVSALIGGEYRLYLELVDGCGANYLAGGATIDFRKATPIKITDGDIDGLWLQVPAELCSQQISGRLLNAAGQLLVDTWVGACLEIDGDCAWAWRRTDDDGAFAITVPTEGKYHVQFTLDGCTVYFSSGSLTTTYGERSTVRVEERDVRLSSRQIPADMCAHRISGRFVHSNGAPLSGEWLNVCKAGECRGFRADENGEFVIRVPADGSYNFLAKLQSEPPCWHHLDGKASGSPNNPIRVSGVDVTDIILRLPGTVEELCE